jgi:hypothetical protein
MSDNKKNIDWQDKHNAVPLFLKCDCHSEGIEIQYFKESESDKGFYINYWKYGITGRHSEISIVDKLKYAWKILRHGTLHGDQIMLTITDSKKLKSYLETHINYDEYSH